LLGNTVKQKKRSGIFLTLLAVAAIYSSLGLVCNGQEKAATAQYDYYSLALSSISNSTKEASKLADISQRVKLMVLAARISAAAQPDEAIRTLDLALSDLKTWTSDEKTGWSKRQTAATLRSEVLVVYASLDPEKVIALQKEFQAQSESTAKPKATTSKSDTSFTEFTERRATADQPAKLAFSLLHANPDRALALVLQSLQDGIVSQSVVEIIQELLSNGNRALLNRFEIGIGEVLSTKTTLDPSSLGYSGVLAQSDKEMPTLTRSAFVSFFMGSLQAWSQLVREDTGLDSSYINGSFIVYSLRIRPALSLYAPRQVPVFDSLMDQLGPLIPASSRSSMQAFQPETLTDPRDRLADIIKDPAAEKRDLRLVRLISEILRNDSPELKNRFELAQDVISAFTDPDAKTAYSDCLTITRMNELAKEQKLIEAQELAGSISSQETRAWALLALAKVSRIDDQVLRFELSSNALRALDKASPSPNKVELALTAAAMLAKEDPQRAFDTLSAASRYANSSAAKIDPPEKPPFAFGLEVTIGEAHARLGVFPAGLEELKIDSSLSLLAKADWFRANQIVDDIREPSLRLRLSLQFAGAMLEQESKRRTPTTASKPAAKN
jgi:hypothetical protein